MNVEVRLHACTIDGEEAVGIGEHDLVVTASVFKVLVALALASGAHVGDLDLAEEFTVMPHTGPPSPYGLATFRHPARLALDELGLLMIGISDNVATDLVLARVGRPAVAELLASLGLKVTAVPQDCREILDSIREDLGLDYDDERSLMSYPLERIRALRALQLEQTCRTTPEEMTRLLGMIWRDEAAPESACADVRRWLGLQVWPHRLSSGFPDRDVVISGKTGTLPTVRNKVGVVEYGDGGGRYAVAVFTTASDLRPRVPARDHFIGEAATLAVEYLRQAGGAG